ncbi:hypothetical protein [Pseudomonas delhiensis]|uniref:hypothetical protein n=1 Tax=Pseudomonas delhiensis TaxID=366289 RepID=UPI00315A6076
MSSDYSHCWAHKRADCGRGMSKEHLISKCLFPEQKVRVSGFDWCMGEERVIGINALQRRFLCEKHNNELSDADAAAKKAIDGFEQGGNETLLSGILLERWLVKTAVNLSVGGNLHIGHGMSDSKPGWPSPYLLAVAFGDEILSAKMGAYFLCPVTRYEHRVGEILVVPIHRAGQIGGFVFGLRGQYIFLSLFPGHIPPSVGVLAPGLLPEAVGAAPLHYRPESLRIQTACGAEGSIQLQWP